MEYTSYEGAAPRTPPHSSEAEKSLIGSALLSRNAMEFAAETVKPEDFYEPRHQDIFTIMCTLYNQGSPVDSVTLIDSLDRAGKLAQIGGVSYVTELALFTPSAANVSHYCRIVSERSVMRRLIEAGTSIINDAYSGEKPIELMLSDAERAIFNISMRKSQDGPVHIEEAVYNAYYKIGELKKLKGALTGIPTGFTDLDDMTSGLQKSDLVIIAARPSMGKTAFALNIAQHAALEAKKTVCVFSLEMSTEQLVQRLICSAAGVDLQVVKNGRTSDDEMMMVAKSLDPIASAAIYIDDTGGISVAEIRSRCRRLKSRAGLDMIVIDYLQLMQTSGKSDNRVTEISEVTRALKIMARELDIPVVLLSQLSRGPEMRKEHRPIMADLRESGAIEQDADMIMMLYRPSVYGETTDNTAEVILSKHRNGPTGTVKLLWLDNYVRYENFSERDIQENM